METKIFDQLINDLVEAGFEVSEEYLPHFQEVGHWVYVEGILDTGKIIENYKLKNTVKVYEKIGPLDLKNKGLIDIKTKAGVIGAHPTISKDLKWFPKRKKEKA